jgi:hypothetical protein
MLDVDGELDRLFGLPLSEFTPARNDLVKRLKAEQAAEAADVVRSLPKPTVPAWTVNQLARVDSHGVRALLEAGEALRAAQQRLLGGEDAGDALREAAAGERDAVERLTERSRTLLEAAGRPATAAVLDRVGATLRAAAVTDEGRHLLETGRFTAELGPPGFDALTPAAGNRAPLRRTSTRGGDELAERRRQHEKQRRRRQQLQEKARAADEAARAAEREAERAEAAAKQARRVAEKTRAKANAAAAALADT